MKNSFTDLLIEVGITFQLNLHGCKERAVEKYDVLKICNNIFNKRIFQGVYSEIVECW